MIQLVELEKAEKKKQSGLSCHKIAIQNNGDTSHITQSGFMARDILVINKFHNEKWGHSNRQHANYKFYASRNMNVKCMR